MTRQVTLVCGPPCAGKTTWVAQHAAPTDTVLDIDVLAKLCGSDRDHGHDGKFYRAAQVEYEALCERVKGSPNTAWVIRGAPEPASRVKWANACGATRVVVLLPPRDVLFARALERDADDAASDTCKAITRWFRRYRHARDDELIN